VSRRTLFRSVLAAIAAPLTVATAAAAAPTSGSTTVQTWTWTTLPGTGLQVHCTDASGRTGKVPVAVSWTADGQVTATWTVPLTTSAPSTGQRVTMAAGYGLAVRRAGAS
jgi:hypothetical protein